MTTATFEQAFSGAKLALLSGDRLITILRDNRADIPFPGMWDFPGGGREGEESPEDCAMRETREELGLRLTPAVLGWSRVFDNMVDGDAPTWFFVAELPDLDVGRIRLGDEGQMWRQMSIDRFLRLSDAVPYLQQRLRMYLAETTRRAG